jgi:hypothetical protein
MRQQLWPSPTGEHAAEIELFFKGGIVIMLSCQLAAVCQLPSIALPPSHVRVAACATHIARVSPRITKLEMIPERKAILRRVVASGFMF